MYIITNVRNKVSQSPKENKHENQTCSKIFHPKSLNKGQAGISLCHEKIRAEHSFTIKKTHTDSATIAAVKSYATITNLVLEVSSFCIFRAFQKYIINNLKLSIY